MLKIALISDTLTESCLSAQAYVKIITPQNYKNVLKNERFDFLFVESCWFGFHSEWKYKIASYKKQFSHPTTFFRNNNTLRRVVEEAKSKNIPTVFWNKEDDVHFDRFIKSACLFEHIFTVDCNSIEKYKSRNKFMSVSLLEFPVQENFHFFDGFKFSAKRSNFVGSYSNHIHSERRTWQNIILNTAGDYLPLDVFDRNSDRKAEIYRYPAGKFNILPRVEHIDTAEIYKKYFISFNVNTITNSDSMFSRRLIEIIACGGMAVSNPSQSINKLFKDYCYTFSDEEELREILYRVTKYGHSSEDLERMRAGASYVKDNFTWKRSLERVVQVIEASRDPQKLSDLAAGILS